MADRTLLHKRTRHAHKRKEIKIQTNDLIHTEATSSFVTKVMKEMTRWVQNPVEKSEDTLVYHLNE